MGAKSLALAIALCSAATISAHAADPRTSENAATQAPAVDGLNFKLDVFGGTWAVDGRPAANGGNKLALHRRGVQRIGLLTTSSATAPLTSWERRQCAYAVATLAGAAERPSRWDGWHLWCEGKS